MKLYVNKELVMPLGKQVSQMAHAYCAFVLGCYDFDKYQFKCSIDYINQLLINSEICFIDYLGMQNADIKIIDQAHTVFNKPTFTTAIKLTYEELNFSKYCSNPHQISEETDVRMILIVNKAYRKKQNKLDFLKESSMYYAHGLINILKEFNVHNQYYDIILRWVTGSFAKITLNSDDLMNSYNDIDCIQQNKEGYVLLGPLLKIQQTELINKLRLL